MSRTPAFRPKSNEEWNGMDYPKRTGWLSPLGPNQLAQQARIRATARGCSVEEVLRGWVSNGMISRPRMAATLRVYRALALPPSNAA